MKLDVNLVWFGILVAVNLQTAWFSPPVALSAYFLKGVVPEMGSERYLFWHDAIHGYSGDRVDPDLCVPTNFSLAAKIVLRRITYQWPSHF